MSQTLDRREFMKLAAYGGLVFASGLFASARAEMGGEDFFFVQLSDCHWGFEGPFNPDARGTLPKAIEAVNALPQQPDFVVFTGDLTHLTLDPKLRRERMAQFRDIVAILKVKDVRFLPGEHDASADHGVAFQEFFGKTHYRFAHKGIQFIVLDNVSDPTGSLGDTQLGWLRGELDTLAKDQPIVILTHRPLFDLYPEWGWATKDGMRAVELLMPYRHVTVFYGHIHQEHHFMTGHIAHHAAKSLIFPLPAPGSQPSNKPLPWDPAHPYRGLGWRGIDANARKAEYTLREMPVQST